MNDCFENVKRQYTKILTKEKKVDKEDLQKWYRQWNCQTDESNLYRNYEQFLQTECRKYSVLK